MSVLQMNSHSSSSNEIRDMLELLIYSRLLLRNRNMVSSVNFNIYLSSCDMYHVGLS